MFCNQCIGKPLSYPPCSPGGDPVGIKRVKVPAGREHVLMAPGDEAGWTCGNVFSIEPVEKGVDLF